MEDQETCPLPEDPVLAEAAAALNDNGQWATIVDHRWRNAYMTDDLRLTFGGQLELVPFPVGAHFFGPEAVKASIGYRAGLNNVEFMRDVLMQIGPWVLADAPGGQRELLELVDPVLRDLVGGLSAGGPAVMIELGLDPDHVTYTPLADLPTATEKARRDAPGIAVCEV